MSVADLSSAAIVFLGFGAREIFYPQTTSRDMKNHLGTQCTQIQVHYTVLERKRRERADLVWNRRLGAELAQISEKHIKGRMETGGRI